MCVYMWLSVCPSVWVCVNVDTQVPENMCEGQWTTLGVSSLHPLCLRQDPVLLTTAYTWPTGLWDPGTLLLMPPTPPQACWDYKCTLLHPALCGFWGIWNLRLGPAQQVIHPLSHPLPNTHSCFFNFKNSETELHGEDRKRYAIRDLIPQGLFPHRLSQRKQPWPVKFISQHSHTPISSLVSLVCCSNIFLPIFWPQEHLMVEESSNWIHIPNSRKKSFYSSKWCVRFILMDQNYYHGHD